MQGSMVAAAVCAAAAAAHADPARDDAPRDPPSADVIEDPSHGSTRLQEVDPQGAFDRLDRLGAAYLDRGRFADAIAVRRAQIELDGAHPQVCVWQAEIARATLVIGSAADRVAEILGLVSVYRSLGAAGALPEPERAACRDVAATLSGQLARAYHAEATCVGYVEMIGHAASLYAAHLDAFPDAVDHRDTRYWSAELSWLRAERGDAAGWAAAARAFTACATDRRDTDDARRWACASAAIRAAVNAAIPDRQIRSRRPRPSVRG
jgi:hypothetical protein